MNDSVKEENEWRDWERRTKWIRKRGRHLRNGRTRPNFNSWHRIGLTLNCSTRHLTWWHECTANENRLNPVQLNPSSVYVTNVKFLSARNVQIFFSFVYYHYFFQFHFLSLWIVKSKRALFCLTSVSVGDIKLSVHIFCFILFFIFIWDNWIWLIFRCWVCILYFFYVYIFMSRMKFLCEVKTFKYRINMYIYWASAFSINTFLTIQMQYKISIL